MNSSKRNSAIIKIVAAILLVGALGVWVLWPRGLSPPDEANRSWHPDGYSIILPPEWEGGPEAAMGDPKMLGRITIHPKLHSLRMAGLSIINWKDQPDLDQLKNVEHLVDGTFQGNPALLFEGKFRGYWSQRIIWKDKDRWFDLLLSTPDQEDFQHSTWWPYVESFKYDPSKSSKIELQNAPREFITSIPSTPSTAPSDQK